MIVECIRAYPDADCLADLGASFVRQGDFFVTAGRHYLVLGIVFYIRSLWGTGPVVEIISDSGQPTTAPLCLFTIIDGRVSRHWEARTVPVVGDDSRVLALQPPSFFSLYYIDDLSEDVPEVVADFARVKALLKAEFALAIVPPLASDNGE